MSTKTVSTTDMVQVHRVDHPLGEYASGIEFGSKFFVMLCFATRRKAQAHARRVNAIFRDHPKEAQEMRRQLRGIVYWH